MVSPQRSPAVASAQSETGSPEAPPESERSLTPLEAGQEAAALVARAMSEVVEAEAEVRTDASHPEHPSSWASATWAAAGEPPFVPGLYFATRVVTLREDVSLDSARTGQLDCGELVRVDQSADGGRRLRCHSAESGVTGWASRTLRKNRDVELLSRVENAKNMPEVGARYVARQRVPIRDRAEVSSARIGWIEAGELLVLGRVRINDTGVPKIQAGRGWASFWMLGSSKPLFDAVVSAECAAVTAHEPRQPNRQF